jgi:hypothetical protein
MVLLGGPWLYRSRIITVQKLAKWYLGVDCRLGLEGTVSVSIIEGVCCGIFVGIRLRTGNVIPLTVSAGSCIYRTFC